MPDSDPNPLANTPSDPASLLLNPKAKRTQRPKRDTVNVAFRLDRVAHAKLISQSTAAGISTRAWLERAVLANETRVVATQQPHPDITRLLFILSRASNNLNQIAHRLNSAHMTHGVSPADQASANDQLRRIEQLLVAAIHHAG